MDIQAIRNIRTFVPLAVNWTLRHQWPTIALSAVLIGIVSATLIPYAGNPSALFHLDHTIADAHPVPKGFVILTVLSYDGAQYYQIARNVPLMFQPNRWQEIAAAPPGAYAYQRILLPVIASALSLGHEEALPWVFLLINLVALLGTCALFLRWKPERSLFAFALCLSPAALLALHFDLSEPLTIFLLTAFLIRWIDRDRITVLDTTLLSGLALSREVNILFVLAFAVVLVARKRIRETAMLLLPIAAFLLLHTWIATVFGQIPFLWSTDKSTVPLGAIVELLGGMRGYGIDRLSSIGLFLFFVLPSIAIVIRDVTRRKALDGLTFLFAAFLGVMLLMPDHIWGSITSIGRVITPVYPLFAIHGALRNTRLHQVTALAILALGLLTAIGLASIVHPYVLA
jgi:hypothetical protein